MVLSVTAGNGCISKYTKTVVVYHLPKPGFFYNGVCEDNPIKFTDTSSVAGSTIAVWNWQFGTIGSSNQQNPIITFSNTILH